MKKILILVNKISPKVLKLAKSIQNETNKNGEVTVASFRDIFIYLNQDVIKASVLKQNLLKFDFVYFRKVGKSLSLAHTLGVILKSQNIPFVDNSYGSKGGLGDKFTSLTRLSLAGLPTIETCFVNKKNRDIVCKKLENIFEYPFVCKDRFLQRGAGVSIVRNKTSLKRIFSNNKRQQFLFQKFTKSKQEYRLLVLGKEVRVFEKKTQTDINEFRANVSLGAKEEFLNVDFIPPKMAQIALKAARVLNLTVAGVDIMEDLKGYYWLIEVNRGPGLTYNNALSPELKEMGRYFSQI